MNIWTILQHASPVNQGILVFLLLMSVFSWIIIVERWRFFAASKRADARFFDSLRGNLDANKIHAIALNEVKSTAGRVYLGAEREVERIGREDSGTWEEALDIERNLLRSEGERGLSFLAIIASSAPFIGLLGTVWGVMIAFLKLGAVEGQPALEVVGPGIAEALIATAMGLFAAIPATIAFNALVVSQRKLIRRSEEFSRRLVATIKPNEGFGR
jgi:biopolymer transport protein TolQ